MTLVIADPSLEEAIELGLEPIRLLSRDLRRSASQLTPSQARYLVDLYYQIQEYRKRAANQNRAMGDSGEPHELVQWVFVSMRIFEDNIRAALGAYAHSKVVGRWLQSIYGIGPVLSAGLLAHIDITQAPTVGHIWRFAGLDSTSQWLGKEKADKLVKTVLAGSKTVTAEHVGAIAVQTNRRMERVRAWDGQQRKLVSDISAMTSANLTAGLARRPWNAKLKVLCWKAGESFVRVCNSDKDIYGHIYAERKAQEQARNERGDYADQAAAILAEKRFSKDTEAYKAYSVGQLPPAHIHARAKRYAVKLLLAGFHEVAYYCEYGKLPAMPYILTQPEHSHWFQAPNADVVPGLREAQEAARKGFMQRLLPETRQGI